VGPPHRCNDLSLFLITVPGAKIPGVDMTLDQAVSKGLVEVTELGSSQVNTLTVRNRGKEPVFAMGGEMLRGGKQDRIIADDLVLPARTTLDVAVYCVEHGRWALGEHGGGGGGRGGFTTGHSLAGADVRQAGGGGGRGGGQGAVWESVARQQRSLEAPSTTGALRSVHDSKMVRDQIGPYLHAFRDLAEDNPKACGVVAVVGDEVLAADLFTSPVIFRQMWPDLLESYAIDAVERTVSDHPKLHVTRERHRPDTAFVVRWLDGLKRAERVWRKTPGEGALYDLHGRDFTGWALVWESGVVHLGLLPAVAQARPEPATRLLTPDQRRQRIGR